MSTPRGWSPQAIARVLVDAELEGVGSVAQRYGVTDRTIRRWRVRSQADPVLAGHVAELRAEALDEWAATSKRVMLDAAAFLRRSIDEGDPRDPEMLRAIVESADKLRARFDDSMAQQMILDARFPRPTQALGATNRSPATGEAAEPSLH